MSAFPLTPEQLADTLRAMPEDFELHPLHACLCPIACALRERGHVDVRVHSEIAEFDGDAVFLPNWAQSYVDQVDGIRGTISPLEALRLLEQVLA